MRQTLQQDQLRVSVNEWEPRHALIRITHPAGLFMQFPASHHNVIGLVAFGQQCIREIENDHALHDWCI